MQIGKYALTQKRNCFFLIFIGPHKNFHCVQNLIQKSFKPLILILKIPVF